MFIFLKREFNHGRVALTLIETDDLANVVKVADCLQKHPNVYVILKINSV